MKPQYEADMRRALDRGVTVKPNAFGATIMIPCSAGHHVEYVTKTLLDPNGVKKHLSQQGWRLGRVLTCPEHAAKPKDDPMQSKVLDSASGTAIAAATSSPSPEARRVRRAVVEALMMCYNEEAKRYDQSYSDAKVAEETGAALAYVKQVREDFFGPLAVPVEFADLTANHEALVEAIATTRRDMATVRTNGEATIAKLERDAAAIGTKIDALARKNGWKQ